MPAALDPIDASPIRPRPDHKRLRVAVAAGIVTVIVAILVGAVVNAVGDERQRDQNVEDLQAELRRDGDPTQLQVDRLHRLVEEAERRQNEKTRD